MARRTMRDVRQITVALTDTQILGPNPGRKGFIISAPQTNRITIWFGAPAVLDQGITLYPGGPPFVVAEDWMGEGIMEDVHAISAVAPQIISVVDLFG